jgi:hypothetical protein
MNKAGSQMGAKSKGVLECLRKNGRLNRLDLEMKLNIGQLHSTVTRLCDMGAIKRCIGNSVGQYEITRHGRVCLGEALEITEPKATRYCNGTMTSVYNPAKDGISRIGLARV